MQQSSAGALEGSRVSGACTRGIMQAGTERQQNALMREAHCAGPSNDGRQLSQSADKLHVKDEDPGSTSSHIHLYAASCGGMHLREPGACCCCNNATHSYISCEYIAAVLLLGL